MKAATCLRDQGFSSTPLHQPCPKWWEEGLAPLELPLHPKVLCQGQQQAAWQWFPLCSLSVCLLHFSEAEAETEISDLMIWTTKQFFHCWRPAAGAHQSAARCFINPVPRGQPSRQLSRQSMKLHKAGAIRCMPGYSILPRREARQPVVKSYTCRLTLCEPASRVPINTYTNRHQSWASCNGHPHSERLGRTASWDGNSGHTIKHLQPQVCELSLTTLNSKLVPEPHFSVCWNCLWQRRRRAHTTSYWRLPAICERQLPPQLMGKKWPRWTPPLAFLFSANWGTASFPQTCHLSGYAQMKGCRNGSFQHTWLRRSLVPNGGNDTKIYTGWKFWCMSPQSQFIFIPEDINNRKAGFLLADLLFLFFRSFIVAPFISPSDFSFCCGFILILVSSNIMHIN